MTHNQHAESSRNIHIYYSHFTYKIFYPLVAQLERTRLQCRRLQFDSWVRKSPWRRHWLPTPAFLGFPVGSAGKESACNVGDLGSIPGLVRSLEKQTAAYSSILAWRIPWTVDSPWGHKELGTTEPLSLCPTMNLKPYRKNTVRTTGFEGESVKIFIIKMKANI